MASTTQGGLFQVREVFWVSRVFPGARRRGRVLQEDPVQGGPVQGSGEGLESRGSRSWIRCHFHGPQA